VAAFRLRKDFRDFGQYKCYDTDCGRRGVNKSQFVLYYKNGDNGNNIDIGKNCFVVAIFAVADLCLKP
jgi:hypothetical protein